MIYPAIAKELIRLKDHDLKIRQRLIKEGKLFNGYNAEMEEVHLSNANRLREIISEIGYPNTEKVGTEASQAAWLIIQHAISLPGFMKNCLALAQAEANNKKIDPVNVVFLADRIAMYENRPQSFGTQFVGGEDGKLIPYQLDDDVAVINERRRNLGLNTIEERLIELKQQSKSNKAPQKAKDQIKKEKEGYDNWRKKVGWIK